MSEKEIKKLLDERDVLLSTDEKKADEIEKQITDLFKKDFNNYAVDFILESLTRFGQSPNVMYDDNGLFAVSSAGYQPVVTGRQKIDGTVAVFVNRQQWKKTIRLALKHYLFDEG